MQTPNINRVTSSLRMDQGEMNMVRCEAVHLTSFRLHEFLREMNDKVLSKYDTITVGEMPFVQDEDEVLRVVARERKELNMIFIFELVDLSNAVGAPRLSLR